jgi:hypothetical protein
MQEPQQQQHQQESEQRRQGQQISLSSDDDKLYRNFIHSIKTRATRENSMKFLGIKNLRELIEKSQKIIESDSKEYLVYLRKERKISYDFKLTFININTTCN